MPTPRFAPQIQRQAPSRVAAEAGGATVTTETVSTTSGLGYTIRGVPTPTRSNLTLNDGDQVSVLWKQGKPFMILDAQGRHGPGSDEAFGGKITEDLFIANDSDGKSQIWFRNATILANLKLRDELPGDPDEVKWGSRSNSFFVRVGNLYHTYKFSRPGGLDNVLTSPPRPKLHRTEFPWSSAALLTTVNYEADIEIETPAIWKDVDELSRPFGPPALFYDLQTHTAGSATRMVQNLSDTETTEVRITQAAIEAGRIVILDAQLDFEYKLVLSLRVQLSNLVTKPGGLFNLVEEKSYEKIEIPPGTIVFEQGDPSACDQQTVLGTETAVWSATAPDIDFYAFVVNVTDNVMLWRSTSANPTLVFDEATRNGSGYASHHFLFIDVNGVPGNTNETHEVCEQEGTPNFDPTQASIPDDPGNFDLPSDTEEIEYSARRESTLYAHDLTGSLSWLTGVPSMVTPTSIDQTRYGGVSFGFRGTLDNQFPTEGQLRQVVIAGHFSGNQLARTAKLYVWPTQYLPKRTKIGGLLYNFVLLETYGITGALLDSKYSYWAVDTVKNTAVMVHSWTTFTGFLTINVLGASLRHVLWLTTTATGGVTTWTIRLSDSTKSDTFKVLATGTTGGFSNDQPPEIQAFFERNWELFRPDLLYLLDDADTSISNKYIKGWSKSAVNLDITKPTEDPSLRSAGPLKKLGDVVPESTAVDPFNFASETGAPDKNPSLRALSSQSALKGAFVKDL